MSTDEFLHGMMAAFTAMDRLVVILAVGGVAVLVAGGLVLLAKRQWALAVVCFVLAAAPFLTHRGAVARQDDALELRAAEVAGFERTPLTADYPRVLEVQMRWPPARVLPMGWFDEVHLTGEAMWPNDGAGERVIYRWIDSPQCAETAEATRAAANPLRTPDTRLRKACMSETRVRLEGTPPDAVILLKDGQTTLRRQGGIHHMGGTLELRVRRDGRELLVDYWEAPYVKRPTSAVLGQQRLQARSEPHERREPLVFLKDALPGAAGTAPTG